MPNLYSLSLCTEPHLDSVGQAQFWSRVSSTTDSIHSEVLHQNHLRPFQLSHNSPSPSVWTHQKKFNSNLRYMTSEDMLYFSSQVSKVCVSQGVCHAVLSLTRDWFSPKLSYFHPLLCLSPERLWCLGLLSEWNGDTYVACLLFFLICLCFSLICCFLVTQWVL